MAPASQHGTRPLADADNNSPVHFDRVPGVIARAKNGVHRAGHEVVRNLITIFQRLWKIADLAVLHPSVAGTNVAAKANHRPGVLD